MNYRKLKMEELGRQKPEDYQQSSKLPVIVLLDNIRSMHNVGSIFRTADAFPVTEIILCGITARPPHREIQKAALGATESVKWKYEASVYEAVLKLKQAGYLITAIEQTTDALQLQDITVENTGKKEVLIFGNEVNGISDELLPLIDRAVEIPQSGTKHSLNVATSAGIILWTWYLLMYKTKKSC